MLDDINMKALGFKYEAFDNNKELFNALIYLI